MIERIRELIQQFDDGLFTQEEVEKKIVAVVVAYLGTKAT